MNQRGITQDLVDLALEYGECQHDKHVLNQTQTFVFERDRKARKLVADAVTIEPVSASQSLLTGKRTGNF
jgi:hypothetical protein